MNEIVLRKIRKKDTAILHKWRGDKDIFRYLGGGYNPITIEKQEEITAAMIKDNETGKAYRSIIELNNKPIGFIGLYDINHKNGTCELGLYIGEKSEWGKGYAKEAYLLIEKYARTIGMRKIKLFVVKDNIAAVGMYNSLDFRNVGYFEADRLIDDKYCDLTIMEKMI